MMMEDMATACMDMLQRLFALLGSPSHSVPPMADMMIPMVVAPGMAQLPSTSAWKCVNAITVKKTCTEMASG